MNSILHWCRRPSSACCPPTSARSRASTKIIRMSRRARTRVRTKQALAHMAHLLSRRCACTSRRVYRSQRASFHVCVGVAMLADRPRAEHLSRNGRITHGDSASSERCGEGSRLAAGLRSFITCSYVSFSAAQGLRSCWACLGASWPRQGVVETHRDQARIVRSRRLFVCVWFGI